MQEINSLIRVTAGHNPALLFFEIIKQMRVLVVDRDVRTATLFEQALMSADLDCRIVSGAAEALKLLNTFPADLVILEIDLEDSNGIELCGEIRERFSYSIHVVFYTDKEEEFIHVAALDAGADDYILKDKKPYYLRSKVSSLLRKNLPAKNPEMIRLNPESQTIIRNGKSVYLSKKEFDVFQFLFSRPNHIFSRSQILQELWNTNAEKTRMLDVHISHLRDKLGEGVIKTVKGIGYGFIQKQS